jgi:hypothetical protein
MEGFWRMFFDWGTDGHCHQQDQTLVYLHLLSNHGIARYHIHDFSFLEEHQALYPVCQEKPTAVSLVSGSDNTIMKDR